MIIHSFDCFHKGIAAVAAAIFPHKSVTIFCLKSIGAPTVLKADFNIEPMLSSSFLAIYSSLPVLRFSVIAGLFQVRFERIPCPAQHPFNGLRRLAGYPGDLIYRHCFDIFQHQHFTVFHRQLSHSTVHKVTVFRRDNVVDRNYGFFTIIFIFRPVDMRCLPARYTGRYRRGIVLSISMRPERHPALCLVSKHGLSLPN
jgi:hypothetical protein